MRYILLLLLSFCAHAQNLYHDSLTNQFVCNIFLTDSGSKFYALSLKMHIDIADRGDSINGATFTYYLYSCAKVPAMLSSASIGISGKYYNDWNANSDTYPYQFVSAALLTRKIKIEFE